MISIIVSVKNIVDQQTKGTEKNAVLYVQCQMIFVSLKKLDCKTDNYLFLNMYHQKLYHYLMQCFDVNKSSAGCFLFDEFCYSGRDWTIGENVQLRLPRVLNIQNIQKN